VPLLRLGCAPELLLTLFSRDLLHELRKPQAVEAINPLAKKGVLLGPSENLVGSHGRKRSDRQGDSSTPRITLKAWPEEWCEAPTGDG
jgi:hypothetical protein